MPDLVGLVPQTRDEFEKMLAQYASEVGRARTLISELRWALRDAESPALPASVADRIAALCQWADDPWEPR